MRNELPVYVVSGLPRSGTSLLMQMLQAGGIPVWTDEKRLADSHNPKGYFELERIKYLASNNSWLHEARGIAIKVVAPLVPFLPTGVPYKILFMQRDLAEIQNSQARMLNDQDKSVLSTNDLGSLWDAMHRKAIEFAKHHPQTQFEIFQHRDVVSRPLECSLLIQAFLNQPILNLESMVSVVDAGLYRNRTVHPTDA